jgi:hypothetical protein
LKLVKVDAVDCRLVPNDERVVVNEADKVDERATDTEVDRFEAKSFERDSETEVARDWDMDE